MESSLACSQHLETLLCTEAIDKLDVHNRITPVNRELIAQGVGNIACGFFGAIPMTAVIVRGAANVDAGATNKIVFFHTRSVFTTNRSIDTICLKPNTLRLACCNLICYRF